MTRRHGAGWRASRATMARRAPSLALRSPGAGARLDERVEEDAVRIASDPRELASHAGHDGLLDLLRLEERRRSGQQEIGPVPKELGTLDGVAVVEVEALHLRLHVAIADGLEEVTELGSHERVAAHRELVLVEGGPEAQRVGA